VRAERFGDSRSERQNSSCQFSQSDETQRIDSDSGVAVELPRSRAPAPEGVAIEASFGRPFPVSPRTVFRWAHWASLLCKVRLTVELPPRCPALCPHGRSVG
jgi:hypothetical protein